MDWKRELVAQELGKGLGFGSLRALIAGHVEGIAYDDSYTVMFAQETSERFQVLLAIGADKREDRLGGESERVGDSDSDAAVADVEAHEPGDILRLIH